ncbi:hypothetical protein DY000_02006417 [Brassica cretica]|uniref:Uncharacterized protein n=1 Tax=Brassica cretica TaxID=69181 RepID=A0ABQ7C364_BRACR|nr:hypothetical protein DY000_02006417 [Brassica cretica]
MNSCCSNRLRSVIRAKNQGRTPFERLKTDNRGSGQKPSHRVTGESTGKSPETGRRRRLTTVVSYQKITGGCGDAATMRRRLPSSGRTVAGYDERPADMVARESHARDFGRRVRPRRGGYPAEIPAPDSFQCHEHTGGVEIARNQTVREISTIF